MNDEVKFPIIELEGTPRERGLRHGILLGSRIEKSWGFYRRVFSKISDARLQEFANRIESHVRKTFPDLAIELQGISEGARIDLWKLFALNSRTELLHMIEVPSECTALYFRDQRILGENWDFAQALEDLTAVFKIKIENLTIVTMAEAGMLGKIGLNSHGLGVCLNRLSCKDSLDGLPVHILLRAALHCSSAKDVIQMLSECNVGSESNMLIGDSHGDAVNVELAGGRLGIYGMGERYLAHTNHYVSLMDAEVSTPADTEHSIARLKTAERILADETPSGWEGMKKVLADRSHDTYPVCRCYEPDELWGAAGTVSTVIMDLPRRIMHYTPGNPMLFDFKAIECS